MGYLASHLFEPHPRDKEACNYPDGNTICAQLADNAIHRVESPEVEQLAAALARHEWNLPGRFAGVSAHRNHHRDWRCGICTGDLHAIAAAVLEIQGRK